MIYFFITLIIVFSGFIIDIYSNKYNIVSNKINKVFLINLKRRTDRLAFFKENYNLKLPLTIIEAVDGKTLNMQELLNNNFVNNYTLDIIKKPRQYHYELTHEGSIGCYLSHYNIWKTLIKDKNENYLIFEDDSVFTTITVNEINYRLSLLPKDWDIYLLINPEYCYEKKALSNSLFVVKRFFLTSAYIINTKGIKKIFNTQTLFPIKQQIDSYLSELAIDFNLNIYVHNKKYKYYMQSQNFVSDIQELDSNPNNEILDNSLSYDRCKL
jgi:GR25 family glycosyltransferase involved in LPS biosynthesis